jgi:hypothetical protein
MKLNEAEQSRLDQIAEQWVDALRPTYEDCGFLLHLLKNALEGREKPEEGFHRVRIAVVVAEPDAKGNVDWNCCGWGSDSRSITDDDYDTEMENIAAETVDSLVTRTSFIEVDVPLPAPKGDTIQGRIA